MAKNANHKKPVKVMPVVEVVLVLLFIIAMYFLSPYILPIFNIKSYVVLTGSMAHAKSNQALFESIWESRGFDISHLPYSKGIYRDDLVIIMPSKDYKIGDVISFFSPASRARTTHRIWDYNSTHFRTIGDYCFIKSKNETVWIVWKQDAIAVTDDPASVTDAIKIFQAPAYEACAETWMPSTYIEGKVALVLPKAGLLHLLLNPFSIEKIREKYGP